MMKNLKKEKNVKILTDKKRSYNEKYEIDSYEDDFLTEDTRSNFSSDIDPNILEEDLNGEKDETNDYKLLRRKWGHQSNNYYDENVEEDIDSVTSASDVDEDNIKEKEASQMHDDMLNTLHDKDYFIEELKTIIGEDNSNISQQENSSFDQELEKIMSSIGTYDSKIIKVQDIQEKDQSSKHPEFSYHLHEMKDKLKDLEENVLNAYIKLAESELITSSGLSYLELRSHLLLMYIQYLCYYMILKLKNIPIINHPVLDCLIELRVFLTQLKPIDERLQPHINKILNDKPTNSKTLKPNLSMIDPNDEEDTVSNDDVLCSKQTDTSCDESKLYKPPKLVAVPYDKDPSVRLEKKKNKESKISNQLLKSDLIRIYRDDISQVPKEINDSLDAHFENDIEYKKLLRLEKMKNDFEQENMCKAQLTKKEHKAEKLLKKKRDTAILHNDSLEELFNKTEKIIREKYNQSTSVVEPGIEALTNINHRVSEFDEFEKQKKEHGNNHKYVKYSQPHISNIKKTHDDMASYNDDKKKKKKEQPKSESPLPQMIQDSIMRKQSKISEKKNTQNILNLKRIPKLDETVTDKRKPNYVILKNKGLTRKRNKIQGNARIHNKLKYAKKIRAWRSIKQPIYSIPSSHNVNIISTGIGSNVTKSVPISS